MVATVVKFPGDQTFDKLDKFVVKLIEFVLPNWSNFRQFLGGTKAKGVFQLHPAIVASLLRDPRLI